MSNQLRGNNFDVVRENLNHVWGYTDDGYWDPVEKKSPQDVVFFKCNDMRKYEKKLLKIVRDKEPFVYIYGESGCWKISSLNLKTVFVTESIVAGPSFDWVFYESHESTFTVGGEWMIGKVLEILTPEDVAHANQW